MVVFLMLADIIFLCALGELLSWEITKLISPYYIAPDKSARF